MTINSSDSQAITQSNEDQHLPTIHHDVTGKEILAQIDDIHQGLRKPPSTMERILSSNARDIDAALKQAELSAINVRKGMIDGLRRSVETYVERYVSQGKIAGEAAIKATYAQQIDMLRTLDAQYFTAVFRRFVGVKTQLQALVGLDDTQRQYALDESWRRAEREVQMLTTDEEQLIRTIRQSVDGMVVKVGEI